MIDNELSRDWLQSRPGERFSIRVSGSATNGSYSVTEILSSPGDSTPVHLHENEDEHILIVEGTARVLYGEKTFDAKAGMMVSLARGISVTPSRLNRLADFMDMFKPSAS